VVGKISQCLPNVISDHFDGSKFREYQVFWNLKVEWEALVIYPNNKCSQSFQTFLLGQKCEELIQHWNSKTEHYMFPCLKCSSLIHVPMHMLKIGPFKNFYSPIRPT